MERTLKKYGWLFVLPTLVAFTIGFIVPFIEGLYLSFCQFTTVGNATFTGFSNYVAALTDASFLKSAGFTVMVAIVNVLAINILAFALAMALTKGQRNQLVPYDLLHAKLDRRYRIGLYLADLAELRSFASGRTFASFESNRWLLGHHHLDVLAASRIYDDHLYCGTAECAG